VLPAIRQVVPVELWDAIWFQQDGCPAHNRRIVTEYLREQFGERVISHGGPTPWPARSPDISPLDFFLWGFVKNKVYDFNPPDNLEQLQERVENVIRAINRHTLGKVIKHVQKRCRKCLEQNGGHVEQYNL
jgi:hypothetical protein